MKKVIIIGADLINLNIAILLARYKEEMNIDIDIKIYDKEFDVFDYLSQVPDVLENNLQNTYDLKSMKYKAVNILESYEINIEQAEINNVIENNSSFFIEFVNNENEIIFEHCCELLVSSGNYFEKIIDLNKNICRKIVCNKFNINYIEQACNDLEQRELEFLMSRFIKVVNFSVYYLLKIISNQDENLLEKLQDIYNETQNFILINTLNNDGFIERIDLAEQQIQSEIDAFKSRRSSIEEEICFYRGIEQEDEPELRPKNPVLRNI